LDPKQSYKYEVDLYSLGCLYYEILNGKLPRPILNIPYPSQQ